MQFDTATVGLVMVIPMVLGIVEAAKRLGVEGKGSFVLALFVGGAFAAYLEAVSQGVIPLGIQTYVSILVTGIVGGLATTGLYDLGTGKNRE